MLLTRSGFKHFRSVSYISVAYPIWLDNVDNSNTDSMKHLLYGEQKLYCFNCGVTSGVSRFFLNPKASCLTKTLTSYPLLLLDLLNAQHTCSNLTSLNSQLRDVT